MQDLLMDLPLLQKINTPDDLRGLSESELPSLAGEMRSFLLKTLSQTGGHLAAGLGAVELTIALHYVFNTPHDRLVWDVGHQSYPHKILTERKELLHTLRQAGGLSGFPKRTESPYDAFGVGHSSTSISAALGMSMAAKRLGLVRHAIAIIGDGGMTAGMAFEALNHAGDLHADLFVILNDNDMSISCNVGALSNYFARVLSGKFYSNIREGSKKVLERMPKVWELARRTEEFMKGMVVPGTLFEELGFNYIGPIDGHDLPTLLKTLKNVKSLKGPQLLHTVTRKGKGFAPAEAAPIAYHSVTSFDLRTGEMKPKAKKIAFSDVFGQWLCRMAEKDGRLMGITPAMREGSGMVEFAERFKDQYVDVGIAEQHSVTVAAGMACDGLKPVVAIYSTFLQRAYDQLIHDVALQNLPVLFAIDRAGIVGPDGATHAGSFDLSYLRAIPNLVVMTPSDEDECWQMLYTGYECSGPAAVRYPRGCGIGKFSAPEMKRFPIGKGEVIRRTGKTCQKTAILVFGTLLYEAQKAADFLDATLVNMRFVKPLDEKLIEKLAAQHDLLVTVEDNVVMGGAGSAVSEVLAKLLLRVSILHLGLPDSFLEHASRETLLSECGLDGDGITQSIQTFFGRLHDKLLQRVMVTSKHGMSHKIVKLG